MGLWVADRLEVLSPEETYREQGIGSLEDNSHRRKTESIKNQAKTNAVTKPGFFFFLFHVESLQGITGPGSDPLL